MARQDEFNRNSLLVSLVTLNSEFVLEIEGAFTTSDGNLDVVVDSRLAGLTSPPG